MPEDGKIDLVVKMITSLENVVVQIQKDVTELKVDVGEGKVRQGFMAAFYGTIGGSLVALMGLALYMLKN